MRHSGDHEEPDLIGSLGFAAQILYDSLVVVHAVAGRDGLIAPAVVHEQLALVGEERLHIRIRGVDQVAVATDAQFNVAIELIRIIGEREGKLGGLIGQGGVLARPSMIRGVLGEWRQGHRLYRQPHKCRSVWRYPQLYFVPNCRAPHQRGV